MASVMLNRVKREQVCKIEHKAEEPSCHAFLWPLVSMPCYSGLPYVVQQCLPVLSSRPALYYVTLVQQPVDCTLYPAVCSHTLYSVPYSVQCTLCTLYPTLCSHTPSAVTLQSALSSQHVNNVYGVYWSSCERLQSTHK